MSIINEQVSPHFSRAEFACKCGCGCCPVDSRLLDGLEALRTLCDMPVMVNSGFRCPKHNSDVPGSSPNSRHMVACAADVVVAGITVDQLAELAEKTGLFSGIGKYPDKGFVHVEVGWRHSRWVK